MAAKPWKMVPLVLPAGDKEYTVQPVDYETGLSLLATGTSKSPIKRNTEDRELFKLVMGPAWDEMLADGQPYPVVFRAGMATVQYQTALVSGLDCEQAVTLAEAVWESGLDPEAVAAALAAQQNQSGSKGSKPSTSTASARKTPSRGSTKRTNSRQTTPRTTQPKKAAPRSPGTPSQGTTA